MKAGHICSEMAAQMARVLSCPEKASARPLPLYMSLNGPLSVTTGEHSFTVCDKRYVSSEKSRFNSVGCSAAVEKAV